MGTQLLHRDINALMRTNPRPQDLPPQIASLVSQKFQLTIGVTTRAFEQAKYSYQVKSIDRVYGRQGRIPDIQQIDQPPEATAIKSMVNKGKRKVDEMSSPSTYISLQLPASTDTTAQNTETEVIFILSTMDSFLM